MDGPARRRSPSGDRAARGLGDLGSAVGAMVRVGSGMDHGDDGSGWSTLLLGAVRVGRRYSNLDARGCLGWVVGATIGGHGTVCLHGAHSVTSLKGPACPCTYSAADWLSGSAQSILSKLLLIVLKCDYVLS